MSRPSQDWSLHGPGVRLVATLELRQRVRSSRWIVMLVLWFATIAVISGLTYAAIGSARSGPLMFSVVAFLVLTLGLLVAPALSATSVNGDRSAGTLATLQVTLLSPADIAVGKLLAAWATALVFLATAAPFLLWSLALGGTSPLRVLVTLVMLALMLLAVCGIALGWSAVCARAASSAVLTYLSVAGLCLFTLIFFGLSVPLVTTSDQVTVLTNPTDAELAGVQPIDPSRCVPTPGVRQRMHTEWTWWLLAANPYVVVADAAPASPSVDSRDPAYSGQDEDVLRLIQLGVREARDGADHVVNECWASYGDTGMPDDPADTSSIWPYGLTIILGLGALGLAGTVQRLRTPIHRLPRGTRVA